MIKYVFFDLGLTLVENGMTNRYKQALNACGFSISEGEAERLYHLANKYFMRERQGELGKKDRKCFEDYMTLVCELAGDKCKTSEVIEALGCLGKPSWKKFDYTLPVLNTLKENGIQAALISNWDLGCRDVLKRNQLYEHLDPIIVSSEVGVEKPDPRIFEKALLEADIRADECIYVGDNYYDDTVGASKAGIKCYVINPPDYLGIEELKEKEIEIINDVRDVLAKLGIEN